MGKLIVVFVILIGAIAQIECVAQSVNQTTSWDNCNVKFYNNSSQKTYTVRLLHFDEGQWKVTKEIVAPKESFTCKSGPEGQYAAYINIEHYKSRTESDFYFPKFHNPITEDNYFSPYDVIELKDEEYLYTFIPVNKLSQQSGNLIYIYPGENAGLRKFLNDYIAYGVKEDGYIYLRLRRSYSSPKVFLIYAYLDNTQYQSYKRAIIKSEGNWHVISLSVSSNMELFVKIPNNSYFYYWSESAFSYANAKETDDTRRIRIENYNITREFRQMLIAPNTYVNFTID